MDEEIEALWLDRELHSIMGSVFDDMMWASSEAADLGWDHADCPVDASGAVSRVVVGDPSERLLRTAGSYANSGTLFQEDAAGRRLIMGPPIRDGEVGFDAMVEANEVYATILRIIFGEEDGRIGLAVLDRSDAETGKWPWQEAA